MVSTRDHAAQTSTDSSIKTTYTGSGPWIITINEYTDTACATTPTTSDFTLETSCTHLQTAICTIYSYLLRFTQ